jgi:hypothetical protein
VNTDSSESFASATKSGNIYFTKENGIRQGDIFMAEFKNGQYEDPKDVGPVINTGNRDANPFISPDEDYLIYAAGKASNLKDSDLFISFRKGGQWSAPINLGEVVNSTLSEFCPFVHINENRLYFSRLERKENRNVENTYYVDNFSALISKLR